MEQNVKFNIEIKDNGEVAFTNLTTGAQKFEGQAHKTKAATNELSETFSSLKNQVLGLAGAYAGIQFFSGSEDYYLKIKRANAEVEASLKSTGGAAGVTNDQLNESAEQLYHNTEYSKESIRNMQAMLLTFPKVMKGNFNESQQAIVDMAAKFRETDLSGFAVRIGKALQDPATGMAMLRREGVNFTKEQTAMVKAMVANGHLAEAQKYIMHELATEFGGSAQAAFEAGGAHAKLGKSLEDLKEDTGRMVDEIETDLLPAVNHVIADFREAIKWGTEHKDVIENIGKAVGILVGGYVLYTSTVKLAAAADFIFGTSLEGLTLIMGGAAAATGEATEAMTALDVAMDANPIGLVVAALGGLIAFMDIAAEKTDTLHYKLNHLHDKETQKSILTSFQNETDDDEKTKQQKQDEDMTVVMQQIKAEQESIDHAKEQAKQWGDPQGAYAAVEAEESKRLAKIKDIFNEMQYELHPELNPDWANNPAHKDKDITPKTKVTPDKPDNSGKPATPEASASAVKESSKQIINTWNIKDFGRIEIKGGGAFKDSAGDISDQLVHLLTGAQADAQIADTE